MALFWNVRSSIVSLPIFREGRVVDRIVGAAPKAALAARLEAAIALEAATDTPAAA